MKLTGEIISLPIMTLSKSNPDEYTSLLTIRITKSNSPFWWVGDEMNLLLTNRRFPRCFIGDILHYSDACLMSKPSILVEIKGGKVD